MSPDLLEQCEDLGLRASGATGYFREIFPEGGARRPNDAATHTVLLDLPGKPVTELLADVW